MRIGITGYVVNNNFGANIEYIDFIHRLGAEPIILAPSSCIDTSLDLLILPGGPDVDSKRYNQIPDFNATKPDPIREWFDTKHLPHYIESKVPIFGICRGMQTLAVTFGCTLAQEIYHETNLDSDPCSAVHGIIVIGDSNKKIRVNSRHHQCVHKVTSDIEVLARHSGISWHLEAISIKGYPIKAVQWHPESMDISSSGFKYTMSLINSIIKR